MASGAQRQAALVALLRHFGRAPDELLDSLLAGAEPRALLEQELAADEGQLRLDPVDPEALIRLADEAIARWTADGLSLLTVLDADYPVNLHLVHDRPPLVFVAGSLRAQDARSVAVIGTRSASEAGRSAAAELARAIGERGFTVVSGLARGIDTAVHRAALDAGRRTVAVIGTGLEHAYPLENEPLQKEIIGSGAVVSCFWPSAPPSPDAFRRRNAVMSGLTRATLVVEAPMHSGARLQTRLALAQGRPVFLWQGLRAEGWARALAERPGVCFIESGEEVVALLDRLSRPLIPGT